MVAPKTTEAPFKLTTSALLWVAALESGDYKEGAAGMRFRDTYNPLGVACAEYLKLGRALANTTFYDGITLYEGCRWSLPPVVQEWLGLATPFGKFNWTERDSILEMADGGFSFADIAKVIRLAPEGLFGKAILSNAKGVEYVSPTYLIRNMPLVALGGASK